MRLFFAVTLPEELAARVLEAQARLRAVVGEEGIRWTESAQFHYTLKFLGELPPLRGQQVAETAKALGETLAPFDLNLHGLGAFPNPERPSVLWVGAQEGADRLVEVAGRLDDILARQGIKRENKSMKAHLTLARIKTYNGEIAAARALRRSTGSEGFEDIGSVYVDRFVLMQSHLKPEGSEYAVVEEFKFSS